MAHSVWEVRQMTELAREKKLATQLGAQRHAFPNMHRVVELIQSGAIGKVSEVHSWVGGTRGMPEVPTEFEAPPSHLKWDLWLGPAKERPYHKAYCPYGWRFWWDFGTGETGNWGCHILDIPFWALDLKYPATVDASGPTVHPETTPKSMETVFEFPKSGDRPAVTLHWQHTTDPDVLKKYDLPGKGANTLFIGEEGMLLCGFNMRKLYPEEKFRDFTPPAETVPDSPGFHREWIDACKGGKPATCHFDYTGPLTETVLLGNTAYRAGGGFTWDADALTAKGNPRVAQYIKTSYREGWEV
jgi:predicted dehydrogenase